MKRHSKIAVGATIIFVLSIFAMVFCCFTGCSTAQAPSIAHTFDKAVLVMPDGEIVQGDLDAWSSFNGYTEAVINGTTYLTHSSNIVMIKEQ